MNTEVVFVYGSLKRGEANHPLLAKAEFLGRGRTEPRFALYCLGPYPAMVSEAAAPIAVEGELYGISSELLEALDRLEAIDRLYHRQRLPIQGDRESRPIEAWAYLYLPDLAGARRWPSASWASR